MISQLVETRIQLIAKLGVPVPPNKSSDLDALLEFFIVSYVCMTVMCGNATKVNFLKWNPHERIFL